MALGANSANDVDAVVRARDADDRASGWCAGLGGASALTGVTQSLLFEVSAFDPLAFAIAGLAMALVGITAAVIPATRATRLDPTTALRSE